MRRSSTPLWCLCLLWGNATAAEPPATSLDLSRWKLTLPVDTDWPGRPDEIVQPRLASFHDVRHFFRKEEGAGVVFRAYCDGLTTKGSAYPRCELREMSADGRREAAWSTSDGQVHELRLRVAVTRLPAKKPHVVCAQIHDARRDVLMVRLEGKKLFVERKPEDDVMLSREYQLGTPLDLKIAAGKGRIQLWRDGNLALDWETQREGCYFKAGCYVQSNLEKGDQAEEHGEVVLYGLQLRHE